LSSLVAIGCAVEIKLEVEFVEKEVAVVDAE
jgi:hypothetical protein